MKRTEMQQRFRSNLAIVGTTITIGLMGLTVGSGVQADSLYKKDGSSTVRTSSSANMANLYTDTRARNVGDVLTVVVSESTTAQSSATTKTSHDDTATAFGGTGLVARFFKDLSLSATNSRSGNGAGSTDRSGTLQTTLSVIVKEVLPNNTLRIEGSRLMGINRETQRVTFTGIVRPEDISPTNTISSTLIAAMEVHYDGRGIIGDTQRQGIISRVLKFLF